MILHVALFAWKPEISKDEVDQILKSVCELKSKIDGIVEIYAGDNFSKWNDGFTHAVVVLAKNIEALESYREYPEHKIIAAKIDNMEAKSIGIDLIHKKSLSIDH